MKGTKPTSMTATPPGKRRSASIKTGVIYLLMTVTATLLPEAQARYTPGVYLEGDSDANPLTQYEYDKCVEDLQQATDNYNGIFEIPAFLEFVDYQSNGLIVKSQFDMSILGLVQVYWFTVCTVNSDTCDEDSFRVTFQEIMEFEGEDDGVYLIYKLCKRVDLYLGNNLVSPTSQPSEEPSANANAPTHAPISQPAKETSVNPTLRVSDFPSGPPSGLPTIKPYSFPNGLSTSSPSQNPTVERSSLPSEHRPSDKPTVPSLSKMPSMNPTVVHSNSPSVVPNEMNSDSPSVSPSSSKISFVEWKYDVEYTTACLRKVVYEEARKALYESLKCSAQDTCLYDVSLLVAFNDIGKLMIQQ